MDLVNDNSFRNSKFVIFINTIYQIPQIHLVLSHPRSWLLRVIQPNGLPTISKPSSKRETLNLLTDMHRSRPTLSSKTASIKITDLNWIMRKAAHDEFIAGSGKKQAATWKIIKSNNPISITTSVTNNLTDTYFNSEYCLRTSIKSPWQSLLSVSICKAKHYIYLRISRSIF